MEGLMADGGIAGRQIVLEDLPRPYTMTDAQARRAVAEAHARRMAREAGAIARACDDHLAASPEAARCRPLQRDPLVMLGEDDVLTRRQVDAGQEIATVFQAITSAVAPRVSAYGERLARGVADDLPVSLRLAYSNRYAPWRDWAGQQSATPRASLADLTLLVCVDGWGCRQVAQRLGMDQRTVKRRLQASLHGYCRLAGWVAPDAISC